MWFRDFGSTDLKPEGMLELSGPRELLVSRSIRAAYYPDGTLDTATACLRGRNSLPPGSSAVPERLPAQRVVKVYDEQVVWAGHIVNHYGHFLSESTSRLWAVLPGSKLEGVPVVFTTPRSLPFISEWLSAFGAQIVELPRVGVVRFTNMYVPEPAWRLNAWIAPEVRRIHLHARRGMRVRQKPVRKLLWLSRAGLTGDRRPYDEALLEWLLEDRAMQIRPETLTLADQVAAIEASENVAGCIGSAFHTLLLASKLPKSFLICPERFQSAFLAQSRLLDSESTFMHALVPAESSTPGGNRSRGDHRILVPEALRALQQSLVPDLFSELSLERAAYPERAVLQKASDPGMTQIEEAVVRVLIDPMALKKRLALGALFKRKALRHCALEQYAIVSALTDDYVQAPQFAARLLNRLGRHDEARIMADKARSIKNDGQNRKSDGQ